jgi:hypothetical protein
MGRSGDQRRHPVRGDDRSSVADTVIRNKRETGADKLK